MSLSAKEHDALVNRQTGIAKKVYEAVPIHDTWSSKQVVRELVRLGSRPDVQIIEGCLNSLRAAGLIEEPERGRFRRAKLRIEKASDDTPPENYFVTIPQKQKEVLSVTSKPTAPTAMPDQVDDLAGIAAKIRVFAKDLLTVADDIEAAALTAMQEASELTDKLNKFRQLQSLMKEFS